MIGCAYCLVDPHSHSFGIITRTLDTKIPVFYSKVSQAKLYKDETSVVYHFETALNNVDKWEWIFDCEDMSIAHYLQFGLVAKLAKLIKKQSGLQKIIILNSGFLIHTTIKFAGLFMDLPEIMFTSNHPYDISK